MRTNNRKRRRLLFIFFALISALIVGIVWASGSFPLTFKGTATLESGKVEFSVALWGGETGDTVTGGASITDNGESITFDMTFFKVTDSATLEFAITNFNESNNAVVTRIDTIIMYAGSPTTDVTVAFDGGTETLLAGTGILLDNAGNASGNDVYSSGTLLITWVDDTNTAAGGDVTITIVLEWAFV